MMASCHATDTTMMRKKITSESCGIVSSDDSLDVAVIELKDFNVALQN